VSVTGFYEFFTNELVTQSPGAGLQNYTFNAPASEHRGIELAAVWKPLPGWQLRGSYTYDDQIYTDYLEQLGTIIRKDGPHPWLFNRNGNAIPGVQPNFLTARVGYDQPTGPLAGLGAFMEYSWRGGFFMDNANLVQAPGYRLVNLNFHYHPDVSFGPIESVTVFLEIENLFDTGYIASANNIADAIDSSTGQPKTASALWAVGGSIYAGAPRTFVGGVRIKL
jgi:iron complex outermembrane receptor protein